MFADNFGAIRQAVLGGAPPRHIQGIATERAPFITLIQPTRMVSAAQCSSIIFSTPILGIGW